MVIVVVFAISPFRIWREVSARRAPTRTLSVIVGISHSIKVPIKRAGSVSFGPLMGAIANFTVSAHLARQLPDVHQIRTQADRLLGPVVTDVDGNSENRSDAVSVFNGPPPTIHSFNSEIEERAC